MAKVIKQKRLLFFINGPMPTEDDRAVALQLAGEGFDVAYRNANLISDGECVEAFDEVAGNVPRSYEEARRVKERTSVREAFVDSEADNTSGKTAKQTPAEKAAARQAAKAERQQATAAAQPAPVAPVADPAAASALAALSGGAGGQQQGTLTGDAQTTVAAPAAPWKPNA